MKRLIEELETQDENASTKVENLTKIKLFLKVSRLTIEKVNEELKYCEVGGEKSLFLMYGLLKIG